MKKYLPIEKNGYQDNDSLFTDHTGKKPTLKNIKDIIRNYIDQKEKFHQIDKNSLVTGYEVHFSIFIHKNLDFEIVLEASDKSPAKISSVLLNIEADFVIKVSDILLFNEYIESLSEVLLLDMDSEKIKAVFIKEKTKIVIRNVLLNPRSGENIRQSTVAVENIAASIFNNKDTMYALISIKTHDYYTYTHSVNVAVLSIGLGTALGLSRYEILNLGIGAILHDIGKSFTPPELLNKQGRLTKSEFRIMQNHVIEGEKILRLHRNLPEESLSATTQHHEKLSGNGYPHGLKSSEIKLFGRIAAIADCYDALTTERPYKPALTPFDALNIIVQEPEDYDRKLLEIFIKMIGKAA